MGVSTLFDCPISVHPSASLAQLEEPSSLRQSLRLDVKRKGQLKPSLLRAQDLLGRKQKLARINVARPSSASSSRPHPRASGAGHGASAGQGVARMEASPGERDIRVPLSAFEILSIHSTCGLGGDSGPQAAVPGGLPPPGSGAPPS